MKRILVIEGDENVRELYATVLARKGFQVVSAACGREGLALFNSTDFDLVITDIFMEDIDGFEVIRTLKNELHNVKIIAISDGGGLGGKSCLSLARSLGADDALPKPVDWKLMEETIRKLLNLREATCS
jgi:DNA-binding response OmpR family regulator